ncbi:MAG: tetratricopeptide repeat protein [Planctomycetes bacterium]|nr:tetratricopeptide repeat protein [Planctomycetota bacterium]MCW8134664.1 tetratricopeptide repeat protein [Planctomycetota bacterium]
MDAETAYLFRHAMLRDVAYNLHLPAERALLHELALSATPATPSLAAERAQHARMAALGHEGPRRRELLETHLECAMAARAYAWSQYDYAAVARLAEDELANEAADAARRCDTYRDASHALIAAADYRAARQKAEAAVQESAHCTDPRQRGICLGQLGSAAHAQGDLPAAERHCREGLVLLRALKEDPAASKLQVGLGNVYWSSGNMELASQEFEAALQAFLRFKDVAHAALAMSSLAAIASDRGETGKAVELGLKAVELAREARDRKREGNALNNLGNSYVALGQVETGIECFEKSLALMREVMDRKGQALVLGNLANRKLHRRQLDAAIQDYRQCLLLLREVGHLEAEGLLLANYAIALGRAGRLGAERKALEDAIDRLDRAGAALVAVSARASYALHLLLFGDRTRARELLHEIEGVVKGQSEAYDIAYVQNVRYRMARAEGIDASGILREMEQRAQRAGFGPGSGPAIAIATSRHMESAGADEFIGGYHIDELTPATRRALLQALPDLPVRSRELLARGTEGVPVPDWRSEDYL